VRMGVDVDDRVDVLPRLVGVADEPCRLSGRSYPCERSLRKWTSPPAGR